MAVPIRFKRGNYANLPALGPGEPAFTLDTHELYIGLNSTTDGNKFFGSHRYWTRESSTTGSGLNFVEGTNNGSAYLTLRAPGSLSGITTFTLPGVDGSSGNVLITDGAGRLSFSNALSTLNITGFSTFIGPSVFQSNVTLNSNLQVNGNSGFIGNAEFLSNLFVGGDLTVIGTSEFVGVVTFRGGTINLGDTQNDEVVLGGKIASDLVPTENDVYSLGEESKKWKNIYLSGDLNANQVSVAGVTTFSSNIDVQSSASISDDLFVGDGIYVVGLSTYLGNADFNGNIDIDGHAELDQLRVSGVSTFTGAVNAPSGATINQLLTVGGDIDLNGDLDVDGHSNLDETDIDGNLTVSGISTFFGVTEFKSNIKLGTNDRAIFGGTNDLQIYNDGSNSYISDVGVGSMFLRGTASIELENSLGTEKYARFNVDGSSELYYDNSKKFETTGTGVTVTGTTRTTKAIIGAATTFTEDLVVQGDARVTGILTVGTSSIIFDGPNDKIVVGGAATVSTSGFDVGISSIHSSGVQVGDSSIHTDGFDIGTTSLHSTGLTAENINITGILTATSLNISGVVDIELTVLGNTYYVAEGGSDSNSGDNINKPFASIAQALSVATNGDIINVSAGVFEETVPLTVPRGVTVKGSGLRATTIKPTDATKTNNVFLLNDVSTVEDFTIKNSYYNSSTDTGYAFSYAVGAAITTRSPYIQRVTVLNTGTTISASDPYGYDTAYNPPTTYVAGRGALIDGSVIASNSLEAGMLFNEVTFFTPNNNGITLTNGARVEYLNCFHYFASQAIVGESGTVGFGGNANVRLKFDNPSVTPSVNGVVKLRDGGGTVVAVGTITSYNSPYAEISGKGSGTFTVGIGTTQDVKFYQSDGTTQTGIADAITLADYTKFGAEMRSVGCAFEYGNQGVVADGLGVKLRLFATNFNHIGSGKDFTNDDTLTVQANEVVELNGGQVSYVSIDQSGDFRVGDAFVVSQETGSVSFAATTYNLETTGNLTVTDGGSNQSILSPTSLTVGDLQLASSTISSLSGDIIIDPASSNQTIVSGDLSVTGIVTAAELNTGPNGIGIGVSTITGPAEIIIDPAGVGDNTGKVVVKGDLQVDGTQTIVNSTTVTVDDKNIVLGSGAINDAAANGGGITLESGEGNKTINWIDSTDSWTFSENVDLAPTKTYKINGVDILSSTTLGSSVVNSSLTSVGTLIDLTVSGAINSNTAIQVNGVSVLDTASGDATALAIALG